MPETTASRPGLTIGQLARQAGVGVETIRYYQRRGLLDEPPRPHGGIRRYGHSHLQRLGFIRSAKQLGFTLDQVGELLALSDGMACRQAQRLARERLAEVRVRRAALSRMETSLAALLQRCQHETGTLSCPLIEALGEDADPA